MTGIELHAAEQTYDLRIVDGRISLAETTPQNQTLILVAHKGEFKEHPMLGVGIEDMLNDHNFDTWKREITHQLEADGQRVNKLSITSKGIELDAEYQ